MSEWKNYRLGEIADITSSKRIFYSEYVSNGVPFYRSKEIIDKSGKREVQTELFISEARFDEINKKFGVPKTNDILLTSVGTLGIPYLVGTGDRFYFKDGNLTWFRNIDNAKVDPKFLFIWLQSKIGKQKLDEVTIGSTQPALTISGLKTIKICLPEVNEQRAIAEVLSSLDDKIDLLHRQNKTLESLAQTLFRHWFIDQANDDWEETSLFELTELVGGGTPKTEVAEYWDGDIKWISGKDVTPNHKQFILNTEKKITEVGMENSSAKYLPQFSTIITARGTVGNYCLLSEDMAFSQSNYGIRPRVENCYFFTFLLIANAVDELKSAAYGSVFDTITTNTFKEHKLTVPSQVEIKLFEQRISPYFEKMLANSKQITFLSKTRDSLLPKLMTGEVSIS